MTPAAEHPSTHWDDLLESINTHKRDIHRHILSMIAAVLVFSSAVALLAALPCMWPPAVAAETWPQCAGSVMVGLLRTDPALLRGMTLTVGTLFIAMLLAVVLIQPTAATSTAHNEAVRGLLVTWTQVLGLTSAVISVYWLTGIITRPADRWLYPAEAGGSEAVAHPVEFMASIVLILFFASTSTLLQPGLGLITSNIRWAHQSLQRIDDWERTHLPRQTAKAHWSAAASWLCVIAVASATHSQWGADVDSPHGQRFLAAACGMAALWLLTTTALNGFQGVNRRFNRWWGAVVGVYLTAMLAFALWQLIPFWAAALTAATWTWTTTATIAAIALSRYHSRLHWRFALPRINGKDRRRYERVIEESHQVLRRVSG